MDALIIYPRTRAGFTECGTYLIIDDLAMTTNDDDFRRLYERYYDRTVAYIMSLGVSREDARDLAQETFIRVYRSMETYRREAKWAYLKTTAQRLALNKYRDETAQKRAANLTVSADTELFDLRDRAPSPEFNAAMQEHLERMEAAIAELSPKKQPCVRLYLQGFSYAEIATALGISEVTVKSRLHEARSELRLKGIELPS